MSEKLDLQSRKVSERIDATEFGMDPLTILSIVTQVLPLVAQCWNRNDEPNPQLALRNLERYYTGNPRACLMRTARRVRWVSDEPLTRKQSLEMAQAIIDQALSESDVVVAEICREVGRGE